MSQLMVGPNNGAPRLGWNLTMYIYIYICVCVCTCICIWYVFIYLYLFIYLLQFDNLYLYIFCNQRAVDTTESENSNLQQKRDTLSKKKRMSKSFSPPFFYHMFFPSKSDHAQLLHFPTALHQLGQQLLLPQPKGRRLRLAGRGGLHLAAAGAARGAVGARQAIGSCGFWAWNFPKILQIPDFGSFGEPIL